MLTWSIVGAAVSVVLAAWKIGVWANRWYIAEQVYVPDVDEAAGTGPYGDITQLLRSGNEALLAGFGWLGVALVCGVLAAVARRRSRYRA
ncbi:hypothetical protein D3C72_2265950 [compost metagenome]